MKVNNKLQMKRLRKCQDKLFKQFETGKYAAMLSPTTLAVILPVVYHIIAKAYRKGYKRAKNARVEKINNLRI